MSLNYWSNPANPNMIRLYVGAETFHKLPELDPDQVKVWIERSDTLMAGWVIKGKGDMSGLGRGLAVQKRVIEALGISPGASWEDLVRLAKETSPKSRARKTNQSSARSVSAPAFRAEEAEALDIASIQMKGPVTIQVDHREPTSLTSLLLRHPMVTVESVSLDLGDIAVEDAEGNRLIIERKRCEGAGKTDFEASIQTDGRLFDQSERLKLAASTGDQQVIPIILLEGDLYRNAQSMLCQQLDGAISFLAVIQQVSVLPTLNHNHTAYVILKLAAHFTQGLYSPVTLHKAKPKALFEAQAYVLESMPGISSKAAEMLLSHFGSVRKVMTASKSELLAIKGLGPKKVDNLLKVLDGKT